MLAFYNLSMSIWVIISNYIIKQEEEKLFDLWWKSLVKLQEWFSKFITESFQKSYKIIIDELARHPEIQINELLAFLGKDEINKMIDEDDLNKCSEYINSAIKIWVTNVDKAFGDKTNVTLSFWIQNEKTIQRAQENAWKLITRVNDYSKQRIGTIITEWIKNGYGYSKIAAEIQKDYSFSNYRARLIASNELWEAYLQWQEAKFTEYLQYSGRKWWKQWMSHRDQHTTDWCLANDYEWRIEFDKEFKSWHMRPKRFIGCRCSIVYRLVNPTEDRLTLENAVQQDLLQSDVLEDKWFLEWMKPDNYDKYTTRVLSPAYFNTIGEKAIYIKPKGRAYNKWNEINLWDIYDTDYQKKRVEAHEVWHFFFSNVILTKKDNLEEFKNVFSIWYEELKEVVKDEIIYKILTSTSSKTAADLLVVKMKDKILSKWPNKVYEDILACLDTVCALSRWKLWMWHSKKYFRSWNSVFRLENNYVTEMQWHEFFAHLNEVYWLENDAIKEILPKTYKAMKKFYKNIWLKF